MKIVNVACCWFCHKSNVTLRNIRDAKGKKTGIYACEPHVTIGKPPVGVFKGGV